MSTKVIHFAVAPAGIAIGDGAVIPFEVVPEITPQDLERASEEGYRRGFEEASNFLNEQMLEQRSELVHLQESTLRNLLAQQNALLEQVTNVLPALAMEIAKRVLAGFEPDAATVSRIVAETLEEVAPGTRGVEVWLNPKDLTLAENLEPELAQKFPEIALRSDADLKPGDCRARSRFGAVDARMSTKLQNVALSML